MTEKEIIQLCKDQGTLSPLIEAVRLGEIKFHPIPRSIKFFFGMRSKEGLIEFEHDIYFYTTLEGVNLYTMIFENDAKGTKARLERTLRAINDGLRGIK